MIKISPFTPLFFNPSTDKYGVESRYVQTFAATDSIFIEVFADALSKVEGAVVDQMTQQSTPLVFKSITLKDSSLVYHATITGLSNGYYVVQIGDKVSEIFKVTDSERDLADTTLIRYSMRSNKQRKDAIFWDGKTQFFFEFRVPGGFKDDDWGFSVNNEQFEISDGSIVELYAIESTQKRFTLGNAIGCPVWFAEQLNRVLCCSHVYFNGQRYVRKGNSTPEKTQEVVSQKSYIFKVSLQGMVDGLDYDVPSGGTPGESGEGAGGDGYIYLIKMNDEVTATDRNTFSALRILFEIEQAIKANNKKIENLFLSKVKPDATNHLLQLLAGLEVDGNSAKLKKGAIFGTSYSGGAAGAGGKIDEDGHGELRSLKLWEWFEAPELRYNSIKVFVGVDWQCCGAGIVESVTPDVDVMGNELQTGTVKLKLEDGQIGAVAVDDIAMGIYHMEDPVLNATSDADDGKGNFTFAGFATSYWRITGVSGAKNDTFTYSLRPGYSLHPKQMMNFACYGNFTNAERQKSAYRTTNYTRYLYGMNSWEIAERNIGMQFGDLSNLVIGGKSMEGYSAYLNNIYMTGTIQQLKKPDGSLIKIVNDRGEWVVGWYDYYDRVSRNGELWLCVAENGTSAEPSAASADWLLQVKKGTDGAPGVPGTPGAPGTPGKDGKDGVSASSHGLWNSGKYIPYMGTVRMGKSSFVCKNPLGTDNPPLYTYMDGNGNRFTYADGGYVLTGEVNTTDYDLLAEDGNDGRDGRDGRDGHDGKQGLQGCILRTSEWVEGQEYRNDEALTSGTRFVDIGMVRDNRMESGWRAFQCLKTHMSTSANSPVTGGTEWTEVSNFGAIYAALIIAKNASLDFVQGNELLIKDDTGNIVAGLTGGKSKSVSATNVRIWAGNSVPNNAPFRVLSDGSVYGNNMHIAGNSTFGGTLNACTGVFEGFVRMKKTVINQSNIDTFLESDKGQGRAIINWEKLTPYMVFNYATVDHMLISLPGYFMSRTYWGTRVEEARCMVGCKISIFNNTALNIDVNFLNKAGVSDHYNNKDVIPPSHIMYCECVMMKDVDGCECVLWNYEIFQNKY